MQSGIARAGEAMLPQPYLLYLGDANDTAFLKTGLGLRDWAPQLCVAEYKCKNARATLGLPFMHPHQAREAGARSMVLSAASIGGALRADWKQDMLEALECGLDVVSGAHDRLVEDEELWRAAERCGRRLIDVRTPPAKIPIATGRKRRGKRLLTIGTDCALGKKYTALALTAAMRRRGVDAEFRATGQTGIMICGSGVPIDAVVSDFIAGAAESLSPDAELDHWDVIEGQGSLHHPSYAGVSLGLLHGSQPDVLVLCHAPDRENILGMHGYRVPPVEEALDLALTHARLTNPGARCAGLSLNTAGRTQEEAERAIGDLADRCGLPAADPMRPGEAFEALVTACMA